MFRLGLLLVVVIAAVLASWQVYVSDPGTVTMEWGGWRVDTSAFFAVLAFAAFSAIALPVVQLLVFLIDAPSRIGKASERTRRRKGNEALALGLIAAESGEFDEARRQSERAADLVEEPRLTNLLQARSAEVGGDYAAAERAYSGMLGHEDTELLGRKGLLTAALKRGDRTAAMTHAEAALRISKAAAWPFQSLFELKVASADWEGALDALEQGEKRKLLDERVARRRRAVLLTAAAAKAERDRRADKAADMAQKAFRISPGFAPAAAVAARLLALDGKIERAADILEEAWENAPHPAIAHAYRDLKPGESAGETAQRMAALAARQPNHRESRLLVAELAIERGDWATAKAALDDAYREIASARVCALYAAAARGRGDENDARNWLNQAASAPREADWSDLDPEGPAFLYDDNDWARLVYVYGDAGQLIHPRLERGGRDAGQGSVLALPAAPTSLPAPSAPVLEADTTPR